MFHLAHLFIGQQVKNTCHVYVLLSFCKLTLHFKPFFTIRAEAEAKKAEGNKAFAEKDYEKAIGFYSEVDLWSLEVCCASHLKIYPRPLL